MKPPQFDTAKLIGTNIDIFHKNPAHQRGMLDNLKSTYKADLNISGMSFQIIASPVVDDSGERIGTVVEWKDQTAEKKIEGEIDKVVTAAVNGNFADRLNLEDKSGFMRNLAESINTLCANTETAMEDISVMLSAFSSGDLTRQITADYKGIFDKIKNDANETSTRLGSIVSEIMVAANEVANAAGEMATGSADLSQRTEQQASNLEETAASMEEMSSTVNQNAENAGQANQLAKNASEVAVRGGDVVSNAIDAMSRIEESSQKISDIIAVIDEIAFQTNLLALNAAVEAARAGDAGKGFAVVASEVRTLAQRSSEAAKDIKGLIVDSGNQVQDGVKLVNNAGESLHEIVESIKRVTDIVSEIAAASNEQATGVEEINKAVTQMDEMTQQNSALVEETAAGARTLQEQAGRMHSRMSFFTIDGMSKVTALESAQQSEPVASATVGYVGQKVAASGGGGRNAVAQMQAAISTAVDDDADWSDF